MIVRGETVEDAVLQFQKAPRIDDELEHSKYGIGQGTEYGWDKLRANAKRMEEENFLEWLDGIVSLIKVDLAELNVEEYTKEQYGEFNYENKERVEQCLQQWRSYRKFLQRLKADIESGRIQLDSEEKPDEEGGA